MRIENGLAHQQHTLHQLNVGAVYNSTAAKVALTLGALLSEEVALKSVCALNLTGARNPEGFLGAGVGLHLRHGRTN